MRDLTEKHGLFEKTNVNSKHAPCDGYFDMILFLYDNSSSNSAIRRFLCYSYKQYSRPSWLEPSRARETVPKEFLLDLVMMPPGSNTDKCAWHTHSKPNSCYRDIFA